MLLAADGLVSFECFKKRVAEADEKAAFLGGGDQSCLFCNACSRACCSLYCRTALAATLSRVTGRTCPFLCHKANASSSVKVEGGIGVEKQLRKGSYFIVVIYPAIIAAGLPADRRPGAAVCTTWISDFWLQPIRLAVCARDHSHDKLEEYPGRSPNKGARCRTLDLMWTYGPPHHRERRGERGDN